MALTFNPFEKKKLTSTKELTQKPTKKKGSFSLDERRPEQQENLQSCSKSVARAEQSHSKRVAGREVTGKTTKALAPSPAPKKITPAAKTPISTGSNNELPGNSNKENRVAKAEQSHSNHVAGIKKKNSFEASTVTSNSKTEALSTGKPGKAFKNGQIGPDPVKKESSSKSVAIAEQKGSNRIAERGAIAEQTHSNRVASTEHLQGNRVANGVAITEQIAEQSRSNRVAESISFYDLTGKEKELVQYIFETCKIQGSLLSPRLTIGDFAKALRMADKSSGRVKNHVQNIVKRVIDKGHIVREKARPGRGGWTQFRLNKQVYQELMINSNHVAITEQTHSNYVANGRANGVASSPSSSNSNILINTNTTKVIEEDQRDWELIQTPDTLKKMGFGSGHIKQIKSRFEFAPSELQSMLEAYAYDIEEGRVLENRKSVSPIGYFFGALKNGGYNSSTQGFKSSEDLAMEEQIQLLESNKREREEGQKRLFELRFEEWLEATPDEEKIKLVEPVGEFMGMFHREMLQGYFEKEVYDIKH